MKKLGGLFLLGAISLTTFTIFTDSILAQSSTNRNASQSIDLEKLTCRELLKTGVEDRSDLIIFMHGYMSGNKGNLRIDVPELAEVTDRVIDNCIDKPETQLLLIFEKYR